MKPFKVSHSLWLFALMLIASSCRIQDNTYAPSKITDYIIRFQTEKTSLKSSDYQRHKTYYFFKMDGSYHVEMNKQTVDQGRYHYKTLRDQQAEIKIHSTMEDQPATYIMVLTFKDPQGGQWHNQRHSFDNSTERGQFHILRHGL